MNSPLPDERSGLPVALPRLAVWLLSRRLPPSDREFFLGDLDESFRALERNEGRLRAHRWFWPEALRVLVHH